MKLFTIVERFSPQDGPKWTDYCRWRGIEFSSFDSIDGILRPSLLTLEDDDWSHVLAEDFHSHLLTDYSYARTKHERIGRGDLLGLRFEDHDMGDVGFVGFDIIDRYCDISLLTNWGNDFECINHALGPNGLIHDFGAANALHQEILRCWGDDPHAEDCQVVSIYKQDGEQGDAANPYKRGR